MNDRLVPSLLVLALFCIGCPQDQQRSTRDSVVDDDKDHPPLAYQPCLGQTDTADSSFMPIQINGDRLVRDGLILRAQRRKPAGKRLVLGVLGDTKEALPATLQHLDALMERFLRASVTAIVVLGGIDPTYDGIRAVLSRLATIAPVLALPGDRESLSGFQAAAQNSGARVIDLVRFHGVVLSSASLIAVPGYYLPHHLLAKEQGCSYDAKDIEALIHRAGQLPAPRILLSHGPPRGSNPQAVDRALGLVNIGDPLLGQLISSARIRFGLFCHVHEAAGHAVTLEGKPVPPMTWSSSLLLNVGSADSVPHENLDGSWSWGSAALVEFESGRARFSMLWTKRN